MTTNQTIDGVPRELIERMTNPFGDVHDKFNAIQELRALLDTPAVETNPRAIADALESSQWPGVSMGNKVLVAAAITELRKAAQPQGEPVALIELRQIFDSNKGADGTLVISKRLAAQLLAEQRARVSVVVPVRLTDNYGESVQVIYAQGWNACIDEVKRLNP